MLNNNLHYNEPPNPYLPLQSMLDNNLHYLLMLYYVSISSLVLTVPLWVFQEATRSHVTLQEVYSVCTLLTTYNITLSELTLKVMLCFAFEIILYYSMWYKVVCWYLIDIALKVKNLIIDQFKMVPSEIIHFTWFGYNIIIIDLGTGIMDEKEP